MSFYKKISLFFQRIGFNLELQIVILTLLLLFIVSISPIPANSIIKIVLKNKSPELLETLEWESSYIKLVDGVILHNVKLKAPKPWNSADIYTDNIKLDFEFLELLKLNLKINQIQTGEITVVSQKKYRELAQKSHPLSPAAILIALAPISNSITTIKASKINVIERKKTFFIVEKLILNGYNLDSISSQKVTADLSIEKIKFKALPSITDLHAKFVFDKNMITIDNLESDFSNGKLTLKSTMPIKSNQISKINLKLTNISSTELFQKLINSDVNLGSSLDLQLQATMFLNNFKSINGTASLFLKAGEISNLPLQKNRLFKLFAPNFSTLRFNDFSLKKIPISKGKFLINNLNINSSTVKIKGDGNFNLEGQHWFNLHAHISKKELSKLPKLAQNAAVKDDNGDGIINFTVSGDLDQQNFSPTKKTVKNTIRNTFKKLFNRD